jgi:alkanesulfonate monooxygenase SsuD/methylene tetrahydromethanopterin reductase-like flavin-dependent oxidoreductase (luciferase family)
MNGTTPQLSRMHLGWLADQRLSWTALLDRACRVEELGFDSIWLSDHVADERGSWLLDPWTTLGALLARVPRIEAGTLVASNSLRAPLLTAHMARTLAGISHGRFVLGIGAGGSRAEHLAAGLRFEALDRRAGALCEACELFRRAAGAASPWAEAPDCGAGSIPLLIGGGGNAMLELAGALADRWVIWGTPDQLAVKGALVSAAAREAGRDPARIRHGAIVMILPDHLPAEPAPPGHWPAELRGDEHAVSRQIAAYLRAGTTDLIVCDDGVEPEHRQSALTWLSSIMSRLTATTEART